MSTTLIQALNYEERAKYNLYLKKIENAQTRLTVIYYSWRLQRILDGAKDRLRSEYDVLKKDNALSQN